MYRSLLVLICLFTLTACAPENQTAEAKNARFEVMKTDAQWRKYLSPEAFRVLRQHGTERAFTSPLNHQKAEGIYYCAACNHRLFSSHHKYDSGTGWPSFYKPIATHAVGTQPDNTLFTTRTEVHCARCGGHLGHVFEDGPKPTGLRYCMNGAALKFVKEPAPR
jgi:peptide-methionine (R)-S-oxide reductase